MSLEVKVVDKIKSNLMPNIKRSKVNLIVGHVGSEERWPEQFEVDHEDPLDPTPEVMEIIERFNETETLRYGDKAKLRYLIGCVFAEEPKKGKEVMTHQELAKKASRAINEVFSDTSVDKDVTKESLETLKEEIDSLITAVEEDIDEEEEEEDDETDEEDEE